MMWMAYFPPLCVPSQIIIVLPLPSVPSRSTTLHDSGKVEEAHKVFKTVYAVFKLK
jgi:hypothetical protein